MSGLKCFLLAVAFLIFANSLHSFPLDTIKKPFSIGGKLHYGTILPHSERIRPLAFNNPFGIETSFGWLNHSEKSIKQMNCYYYTGIAIDFIDFGHPKIGKSINAWYYFEPLLRFQKKMGFGIRSGVGISYLTKVYDENTNPENKFFASHLAFLLLVEFKTKYKISKKLELTSSICYNHISNGGIKQPNYGMNFPTITIGADYHFNPVELKPITKERLAARKKIWKLKGEVLSSIKVQNKTEEFEEKACFAYGIAVFADKRVGKFSAINLGAEFVDDGYVKEELKRAGLDKDHKRAAAFVGHDLIFGKINFTINWGVYFYAPYPAKDPYYQKYLLQYNFNQRLYAGGFMLAHGDAAEIMGFNVGYAVFKQ